MIEFVLKNRKLRLHPDGIMYIRDHRNGVETKSGCIWKEVKCKTNTIGYKIVAITLNGIQTRIRKHRLVYYAHHQDWDIFNSSPDNSIDHINGIRDDNRIENLRVVTNQQNHFNNHVCKGYNFHKKTGKWRARIKLNGEEHHLGLFENEEDARNAYIKKKLELHLI